MLQPILGVHECHGHGTPLQTGNKPRCRRAASGYLCFAFHRLVVAARPRARSGRRAMRYGHDTLDNRLGRDAVHRKTGPQHSVWLPRIHPPLGQSRLCGVRRSDVSRSQGALQGRRNKSGHQAPTDTQLAVRTCSPLPAEGRSTSRHLGHASSAQHGADEARRRASPQELAISDGRSGQGHSIVISHSRRVSCRHPPSHVPETKRRQHAGADGALGQNAGHVGVPWHFRDQTPPLGNATTSEQCAARFGCSPPCPRAALQITKRWRAPGSQQTCLGLLHAKPGHDRSCCHDYKWIRRGRGRTRCATFSRAITRAMNLRMRMSWCQTMYTRLL